MVQNFKDFHLPTPQQARWLSCGPLADLLHAYQLVLAGIMWVVPSVWLLKRSYIIEHWSHSNRCCFKNVTSGHYHITQLLLVVLSTTVLILGEGRLATNRWCVYKSYCR